SRDWSSDVCSSDLLCLLLAPCPAAPSVAQDGTDSTVTATSTELRSSGRVYGPVTDRRTSLLVPTQDNDENNNDDEPARHSFPPSLSRMRGSGSKRRRLLAAWAGSAALHGLVILAAARTSWTTVDDEPSPS